jgi:hypothetical protein
MATYLSEDFEVITDWTSSVSGAGEIIRASNVKVSGTYSVRITSIVATDTAYMYKALSQAVTGDYHIQFYIWPSTAYQTVHMRVAGMYDVTNTAYHSITTVNYNGGNYYLNYYTGGAYVEINYILPQAWTKVDIYYTDAAGTQDIYIDNVLYAEGVGVADSTKSPSRVYLGDVSVTSVLGRIYMDDLVIDDAMTEPTTTTSSKNYTLHTTSFLNSHTFLEISSRHSASS